MACGVDTGIGRPGTLLKMKNIVTLKLLDRRCGLGRTLIVGWNQFMRRLTDFRLSAAGIMHLPLSIEEHQRRRSLNGLTRIIFLPGEGGREVSYLGS